MLNSFKGVDEVSLDLTKVASQVEGMVARLKSDSAERREHLQHALAVIGDQAADLEHLNRKIAASKTTWLVAGLVDGISQTYKAPPLPAELRELGLAGALRP